MVKVPLLSGNVTKIRSLADDQYLLNISVKSFHESHHTSTLEEVNKD